MKKYIQGSIRRIIYESNSGPYKVGVFRVKDTNTDEYKDYVGKTIGFTGDIIDANGELDYVLYGEMIEHPKYGIQFKTESYEIKEPTITDAIILYLSSGIFKGIGVKTAKKIVEVFSDQVKRQTIRLQSNDFKDNEKPKSGGCC